MIQATACGMVAAEPQTREVTLDLRGRRCYGPVVNVSLLQGSVKEMTDTPTDGTTEAMVSFIKVTWRTDASTGWD